MRTDKESYRQIIKTTSLFGGVQVIQILTTLVRGKLIAILLGAAGLGIYTLYNSAITLIVQFSSFGLNFSAVRDISQATEKNDNQNQSRIIIIFKRWMIFCSVFGALIICLCSKLLSKFTFGNYNYTWGFICLSLAVVLTILHSGNITVLQGTRRLKDMAKASVFGSVTGLFFCIPIYFYYKENGIIGAFVISSLFTFVFSWFFLQKQSIQHSFITIKDTIKDGAEMAKLGIAMMVATLLGTAVNYIINAYISNFGSIADVGLFGAGMSITNQYIGVLFTAMAVDYFPKLSAICNDKAKVNEMVNQQAEIVLLIASPLLIGMMLTAPILIKLLLSSQFLSLKNFVCWAAFAMLFKSASFAMGYISFAKGDKKIFFFFEGVFNSLIILIASIIGYKVGGINGIVKGVLISNIIYIINVNILTHRRYGFKLSKTLIKFFLLSLVLLGLVLTLMTHYSNIYGYVFGIIAFVLSVLYSLKELDKRVELKSLLLSKIKS